MSTVLISVTGCSSSAPLSTVLEKQVGYHVASAAERPAQPDKAKHRLATDIVPGTSDLNTEPGLVTVVFKNDRKVRKLTTKKLKSNATAAAQHINDLLDKYGLLSMTDFAAGDSEVKCDQDKTKADAYWDTDIPHLMSMYVLRFPTDVDTEEIVKKLRALPDVRLAYRTLKTTQTSLPVLLNRNTQSDLSGTKPSDPLFTNPENDYSSTNPSPARPWYWFN